MKKTLIKKTRFNVWVWRNLPPCKEIVKLITAAEDGKISLWNRLLMKIHIRACPPCENFLKQLKFLRQAFANRDEKDGMENPSIKLSDDARERLKNALKSSAIVF